MEEGVSVTQRINAPVSGYVAGGDMQIVHQTLLCPGWQDLTSEALEHKRAAAQRQIKQARKRMNSDPLNTLRVTLTLALVAYLAIVVLGGWQAAASRTMTANGFVLVLLVSCVTVAGLCCARMVCQGSLDWKYRSVQAAMTSAQWEADAITIVLTRRELDS